MKTEYSEHNERQTTMRTGDNPRDVRVLPPHVWRTPDNPPRVWRTLDNPTRCPVQLYKKYKSLRPADYNNSDAPFYLATCCKTTPDPGQLWFKRTALGKNMATHAQIPGNKSITNHSAQKHLVQKLVRANVPKLYFPSKSNKLQLPFLLCMKTFQRTKLASNTFVNTMI